MPGNKVIVMQGSDYNDKPSNLLNGKEKKAMRYKRGGESVAGSNDCGTRESKEMLKMGHVSH